MKLLNKTFGLLFVVSVIFSCGNNEIQNDEVSIEVAPENLVTAEYAIEGMVCAMGCASTIEEDVAGMNGVVVASVDYESRKAFVEFDESVISEKEITAKIESIADGQYKVSSSEKNVSDESEDGGERIDENITEVSLPTFEIPNLFTLLMDQL